MNNVFSSLCLGICFESAVRPVSTPIPVVLPSRVVASHLFMHISHIMTGLCHLATYVIDVVKKVGYLP